jgi:hypothetical protein
MNVMPLVNPEFFGYHPPTEGLAVPMGAYYIDHTGIRKLDEAVLIQPQQM